MGKVGAEKATEAQSEHALSDYELKRLANIKRNQQELARIGIEEVRSEAG